MSFRLPLEVVESDQAQNLLAPIYTCIYTCIYQLTKVHLHTRPKQGLVDSIKVSILDVRG